MVLPYLLPVALALAGFGLLWFVLRKGKTQGDAAAVEASALENTQAASYPLSVYEGFAENILSASVNGPVFGFGTDEDAIFEVFRAMRNDLDVALLIKAFGDRRAEFTATALGLSGFLQTELGGDEIGEINSILAEKGIKYRF